MDLAPEIPNSLPCGLFVSFKEADRVFVPGRIAKDLVAPYREATVLDFPMTDDESKIRQCLLENADKIAPAAQDGLVVFGILGDPNFFSTFSRLCSIMSEKYPTVKFRTERGMTSITAFAAAARDLVDDSFMVSDGQVCDSRILLKVRRPKGKLTSSAYKATAILSWSSGCTCRHESVTER